MNLMAFDLNLLRVLDALLQTSSTVRAAEMVGLSQPAVSAALGRLRQALQDPLFIRQGQGLRPTDFAQSLANPLRSQLDALETLLSAQKFDPSTTEENFVISGSDFFAELLMPELARRISAQAPGIIVQQVDIVPDDYAAPMQNQLLDIVFLPKMDFPNWVETVPVFHSSFVMVARNGHPALAAAGLRSGDMVPLDLFCALSHVLMSPEGKLRVMMDAELARIGRKRKVAMTLPFFSGIFRAVAQTDHVAMLPRQLAEKIGPEIGIEIFQPPIPAPRVQLHMAWHRRSSTNPAHRWLRDLIRTVLLPLNIGEPPL